MCNYLFSCIVFSTENVHLMYFISRIEYFPALLLLQKLSMKFHPFFFHSFSPPVCRVNILLFVNLTLLVSLHCFPPQKMCLNAHLFSALPIDWKYLLVLLIFFSLPTVYRVNMLTRLIYDVWIQSLLSFMGVAVIHWNSSIFTLFFPPCSSLS